MDEIKISPFEKGKPIIDTGLQTEIREALFDLWRRHENWGTFDEGDLLEIYLAIVKILQNYEIKQKG